MRNILILIFLFKATILLAQTNENVVALKEIREKTIHNFLNGRERFQDTSYTKEDSLNNIYKTKIFTTNQQDKYYIKAYDNQGNLRAEGFVEGSEKKNIIYLSYYDGKWTEYLANGSIESIGIYYRDLCTDNKRFIYNDKGILLYTEITDITICQVANYFRLDRLNRITNRRPISTLINKRSHTWY